MLVKVHKFSNVDYEQNIEINSIEELENIKNSYSNENTLVISSYMNEGDYIEVLIYDNT